MGGVWPFRAYTQGKNQVESGVQMKCVFGSKVGRSQEQTIAGMCMCVLLAVADKRFFLIGWSPPSSVPKRNAATPVLAVAGTCIFHFSKNNFF